MSILSLGGIGGGLQSQPPPKAQQTEKQNAPNNQSDQQNTPQPTQPTSSPSETNAQGAKPVEAASNTQATDLQTSRAEPLAQGSSLRLSAAVDELSQARAQALRVVDELRSEGIIAALSETPDTGSLLQNTAKAEAPARAEVAFNDMKNVDATYGAGQDADGLSRRV